MKLATNLNTLFSDFDILENTDIKTELFDEDINFIESHFNLKIYSYKEDNQIKELFLVLSIKETINPRELNDLIKKCKTSLLAYFNFNPEVKKLYYNSYLILLISKEITFHNHILNEILLDKEVMRKIIIQTNHESTLNLLPFLDNTLSNLDKSSPFINEKDLNSLFSKKKYIENTSLDDIFKEIQTKIEKGDI